MKRIALPEIEPISYDQAVDQLGMTSADADNHRAMIEALIAVARTEAETETDRALITQTWQATFNCLSTPLKLARQSVQSVVSITYVDADGATQTLAEDQYRLTGWDSSEIIPAYGVTWPTPRGDVDCVTVTWVAGYGDDVDDVPPPIRQWLLVRLATLFEHREEVITGTIVARIPTIDSLLSPYKVLSV